MADKGADPFSSPVLDFENLRKREDSNLRYPCGHTAFRVRPIQPLWHASFLVLLFVSNSSSAHPYTAGAEAVHPLLF